MSTSPTELTGRVLADRYTIESLAAEEMLGNVYVARDAQGDRLVHVKVMSPFASDDPARFARFGREITASLMIAHPNTVEVLDWGQEDHLHYLVLEYLVARPLSEALNGQGLPIGRVASVAAQIAGALGAAHQEGIVHRALSPGTVLLLDNAVEGDFVKVRDFGMSKLDRADDEEDLVTSGGHRVGDHEYMAPEYIQSGSFHPKGDVYALGALMVHLLTGQPPFAGKGATVLMQHVQQAPPAPSTRRADVPKWMDELVLSMLQKRPSDRPGAYKVVQRLEAGLGRSLELSELHPLDNSGHVVVRSTSSTGPGRWALVAAATLVVGGGLAAGVVVVAGAALVITLGMM